MLKSRAERPKLLVSICRRNDLGTSKQARERRLYEWNACVRQMLIAFGHLTSGMCVRLFVFASVESTHEATHQRSVVFLLLKKFPHSGKLETKSFIIGKLIF